MVTFGNHINGYMNITSSTYHNNYNNQYSYKYFSKDISNLNSRFMNNNQPVNKSLYFNTQNSASNVINKQFYIYQKYPSLLIDNNNTIHVICNLVTRYIDYDTGYGISPNRNYHFLTMNEPFYKINTKATAITKSTNSLSTSYWTQITDFILSDSNNNQTALYTICYQIESYDYWYVFNGSLTPRIIMIYNRTSLTY
jgi:hypothetical protein